MSIKGLRNPAAGSYKKTSSEIICQNMGVESQTIFQDYRCTFKDTISYFGRLYVGEEHIMFVSNMFGFLKKIAIPMHSIQKLEEIHPKSITLTGIRLQHKNLEQFLFTGLSNNHAFKIINAVWKKEKLEASLISNDEDQKQDASQVISTQQLDSSQIEISLFNASGGERERVKMLQIVFPCSVQQFYAFFLDDNAQLYNRKKHLQLKNAQSIEVSPWKRNEELNADTREISAIIKVKGVPLMSEARMNQVCILSRNQKKEISLKVITNMGDVPYHSYFNCEQHITVTTDGEHRCRYTVHAAVIFNKPTYMKNHIVSKTFIDFNEEQLWSENCKKYLETKRLQLEQKSKKEEKRPQRSISVQFEDVKQIKESEANNLSEGLNGQKDALTELLHEMKEIKRQLEQMRSKQNTHNILITACILLIVVGCPILLQLGYRQNHSL